MKRPDDVYDREREWSDLTKLVRADSPRLKIGILYGRRRYGKSYLLRRLVQQAGGLYHLALEQERQPALLRFASAVAKLRTPPPPLSFADWDTGLRYLLGELGGRSGNAVLVLDEYPYLQATSPELDSVLQAVSDDVANGSLGTDWKGSVSVILCGSAMSVMTELLSGSSPLRGRAVLDTPLNPFDFRQFKDYWGIQDPMTAFLLHAVLGGAPGYRDLTSGALPPTSPEEIHGWLGETALNPSHALYREDAYLLREDPRVTKQSLYYSLLNSVASGASTRSGIAAALGRKASDLDHPLNVLLSAGFLTKEEDFLSRRSPSYRIADPIIRFHELVTRPHEALAEEREVGELWEVAAPTFRAQVVGPHFEEIARAWTARYGGPDTLGGTIGPPRTLQVNDRTAGRRFQLDVVAATRASASRRKKVIQVFGEAKGTAGLRSLADLSRLETLRGELESRSVRFSGSARFLLFSLAGFDAELTQVAAQREDVELVDLPRIYSGA